MANIVKIKDVVLMTALTEDVAECYECKKLLDDAGIKHQVLHYGDESAHASNFEALSTWAWGPNYVQREFTKFPVIMWKEHYDDYERWTEVATSAEELKASRLLPNADKVA